ncbi:hypothetical protein N9P60_00390 [bacterium]|nr:hypothetical protein [bacterium]
MATLVTASIEQVSLQNLFSDGFELQDQSIIPNQNLPGNFTPGENTVEFFIYDSRLTFQTGITNFEGYQITKNSDTTGLTNTDSLTLSPENDVYNLGYDNGQIYAIYNFINYELNTSPDFSYYISEISSDRTELRLNSNFITNEDIELSVSEFKLSLESSDSFDEFYLNFGDNGYVICVNVQLDKSTPQYSILIKLYEALPLQYALKDELSVVTKVAESQGFNITFPPVEVLPEPKNYIQGPNMNLDINDFVNNSTDLKSKTELTTSNSKTSEFNLQNVLNEKGIKITPNYSYDTFGEFVNFSSAKSRINNFIKKLQQIEEYQSDIDTLESILTPTPDSISNIATANTNIEDIIKNFDGYEYYLYYNDSTFAYPKSTTTFPYTNVATNSVTTLTWLGSDVEGDSYYGGILLKASRYDEGNQNWLYYTIPEYLRNSSDNDSYIEYCNMVGQHFDEVWLYTKAYTSKLNTTNELDKGVPLKMVEETIRSLGYKGHANNYNNQDNFIGLTGENSGSYLPPTGSEDITNYIAVNGGNIVNYWDINYSYLNYVQQLADPGYPYAIDKVSKEIFKRLYHNMSYLVKKKGTISGLRQLINIWGIPSTILRINEFGGKNTDNSDDYDLWYKRYSYAFNGLSTQNVPSASVLIPWMPLTQNGNDTVPDNLQFRFKTEGYPTNQYAGNYFTQSLAVKKSDGDDTSTEFDFGISLFYSSSATASYSGSSNNDYYDYGTMRFYISGAAADGGVAVSNDIYLPFFNEGWWSVMLQRDTHPTTSITNLSTTYTLYVKNKLYNGFDGNSIGFEGSASIVSNVSESVNAAWNNFGTGSADGMYLGGFVSGSTVGGVQTGVAGKMFYGSLQEFRYYTEEIPETVFNDFVMNPESVEGITITGDQSSHAMVAFRAPLGNELESKFTTLISSSHSESFNSMHPASSGQVTSLITSSFTNTEAAPTTTSSLYNILYYENSTLRTFSKPNVETYFLDQPAMGIRNRISNKIQIEDTDDFGKVLSNQKSIEQDYQISRSYTEDITSLEVGFSPQDEVNDDIIQTYGYGVIADTVADPRNRELNSDYYSNLRDIADDYFKKYTKGNLYDYIRLIKYFDNSIFKAIKSYVPARTSVSTGIIIKQHLLERNKHKILKGFKTNTQIAVTPSGSYNTPISLQNLELTSSIEVATFTGGTGGTVEEFNYSGSPTFFQTPITQSYLNTFDTVVGLQTIVEDKQDEFYDGEFSGSNVVATTQSLFNNPFLATPNTEVLYDFTVDEYGIRTLTTDIDLIIGTPTNEQLAQSTGSVSSVGIVVWIDKPSTNNTVYEVTGIAALYEGNGFNTDWDVSTLGLDHDGGSNAIFPISSSYHYSNSGTSYDRIPFFRFNISRPDTGSLKGTDPDSGGIEWSEITSFGLIVTNYGTLNNGGGRYWKFLDEQTSPYNNAGDSRVIIGDNASIIYTKKTGETRIQDENVYFLSPTKTLLAVENSSSIGEAVVSMQGLSFWDSATPSMWQPFSVCFNDVDKNGNSNRGTFKLNPSYEVDLDAVNTAHTDSYGLSTDIVKSSTLSLLSNNHNIPNSSNLFQYRIQPQRENTRVGDIIEINPLFNPYIDPSTIIFDNSIYNAIPNNFNDNRSNSFLMNVDYTTDATYPSNRVAIINGVALKAETPDSNYTSARIIRPRYEGSRLSSANYNHYTPAGTVGPNLNYNQNNPLTSFQNGDTGSWGGDISYGKTATIDSYPQYVAHYTRVKENYNLWDTYIYTIDQLIEIPQEGIKNLNFKATTVQVDESNDKLYEVEGTFGVNRKAILNFNTSSQLPVSQDNDFKQNIFQGGLNLLTLNTNEKNRTDSSTKYSYLRNSETSSGTQTATDVQMVTGSGHFILSGSITPQNIEFTSPDSTNKLFLRGAQLAVYHTYNQLLYNAQYIDVGSPDILYVEKTVDRKDINNYFRFQPSASDAANYENSNTPFLILSGDEIRVEALIPASGSQNYDFTVTGISTTNYNSSTPGNNFSQSFSSPTGGAGSPDLVNVYDRINVSPDPSVVLDGVVDGAIYRFTVRRRINTGNKVILTQSNQYSTGEGFLIPNDLSLTQKKNVQDIINQLKGLNVFPESPPQS